MADKIKTEKNTAVNIDEKKLSELRAIISEYTDISGRRLSHTLSVEKECGVLAEIFGLCENDRRRLCAAALLHDITKEKTLDEQLALCRHYDIDYPHENIKQENLYSRPPRIPYNNNRRRDRHYGKTLELMIRKATELQPGMEKDQLVRLLANQMKKSFLTWNKESVDDRKIYKDLDELSSGKIVLSEEEHKLAESRDILARNNSGAHKRNCTRKGR